MATDRNKRLSRSEEQTFVARIATHYTPTPLIPAQRLAFDRALEDRLERRASVSFFRPLPMLAATTAAFLVWLVTSSFYSHTPTEVASSSPLVTSAEIAPLEKEENLLIYAYYSSDFDEDEAEDESESFLPDEYEAFDSALLFPGA